MALNGLYPILLVGLSPVLTKVEQEQIKALSALSVITPEDCIQLEALKAKAEATAAASMLARVPIIFDGKIIPAFPDGYRTSMIKNVSMFEDRTITTATANTVTINIKTSSSAEFSVFSDLLFTVADILFQNPDYAPAVSYFGGNVVIPNGYLVGLSRSSRGDTSEEVISLEIAKDLRFIFDGFGFETEVALEKPVYAVSESWETVPIK